MKKLIIIDVEGVLHFDGRVFPGAKELLNDLYAAGYQVVAIVNSDLSSELQNQDGFVDMPKYNLMGGRSHDLLQEICVDAEVQIGDALVVATGGELLQSASKLNIAKVEALGVEKFRSAALAINHSRTLLISRGLLRAPNSSTSVEQNLGKYPSLFGMFKGNVVRYSSYTKEYVVIDEPNADGNHKKRCYYQSRLAQLIVDQGRDYWQLAYQKINNLFLADFDLKAESVSFDANNIYFMKIKEVLLKEKLLASAEIHTIEDIRAALVALFSESFDLPSVSQFYYGVWLFPYGPEPLESFVFDVDKLATKYSQESAALEVLHSIILLKLCVDMAHNVESRAEAYAMAQTWVTCGKPQLRGRMSRGVKSSQATTIGIMPDLDASDMPSVPHFAAKEVFKPAESHPIAYALRANAGAIIGGSSGTIGRNLLMLAPLVERGLLAEHELKQYLLGFAADLVYRGHHSYDEILIVANQILYSSDPAHDAVREPRRYYEQLLTEEFLDSQVYKDFTAEFAGYFEQEVVTAARLKV